MKSLANFLLFQVAWFATVAGAARGWPWLGPAAVAALVGVHLLLAREGRRELRTLLVAGIAGTAADSLLQALGVIAYAGPAAHWPPALVPPWITALWVAFATLPRFSMAWLAPRPWLAALLGAAGGPLSYLAAVRLGAVATGELPWLTWTALALEYALATPLLLRLASRPAAGAGEPAVASDPDAG